MRRVVRSTILGIWKARRGRHRPDGPAKALHRAWDEWRSDAGRDGVRHCLRVTWGGPTVSDFRTEADDLGDLTLYGAGAPSEIEDHLRSLVEDVGAAFPDARSHAAAVEVAAWMRVHAPRLGHRATSDELAD